MKPTDQQIAAACKELGAIPYFPSDDGARTAIMRGMRSFVADAKQLRWLVDTAVDHMRQWAGVAELRGLYCTRFKPMDGVEATCQLQGFTPADNEISHLYSLPQGREELKRLGEVDATLLKRLQSGDL